MSTRHPHPTLWTVVMRGGPLLPGEHAMTRRSQRDAEDVAALYRREAAAKGEPFVSNILPPTGWRA